MIQRKPRRPKYWWYMLPKSICIWMAIIVLLPILIGIFYPHRLAEVVFVVAGAVLAAIFQISGAYHAKVSHFLECFSRCNECYAKLNGRLKQPTSQSQQRQLPLVDDVHNDAIIDYFNLCAEEHLMHQMGVIPEPIWQVWCDGIHDCARADHIKKTWDEEKDSGYYGFDLERLMSHHHDKHGQECKHRPKCPWAHFFEKAGKNRETSLGGS